MYVVKHFLNIGNIVMKVADERRDGLKRIRGYINNSIISLYVGKKPRSF